MQINDEVAAARRAALLKEISARLKPVCAHYRDEDFAALIGTMADRQLAGEARLSHHAPFRVSLNSK